MQLETGITWVAAALYFVGCLLAFAGLVWRSERPLQPLLALIKVGLAAHGAAIGLRWARVAHGPYISIYEVVSSNVWIGVFLLLLLLMRQPTLKVAAGPVLGVGLLLIGWSVTSNPETQLLPPTFRGVWLVIHILFAKVAFGSILLATGLAIAYLVRARGAAPRGVGTLTPPQVDELVARLVGYGFVACTFMIAAGAIWARNAWGRYWSWDPLETWALAVWVAYGLFLHARLTYKVRGVASALGVVALLGVSAVGFFVVPLVSDTIHTEFMVD